MSKRYKLINEPQNVQNLFSANNKSREYDLTRKFNLSVPRSACPTCNHEITALENIPVLSWLVLKGKCSNCRMKISVRYPLIEMFTSILFVVCAYISNTWLTFVAFVIFSCLSVCAISIFFDNEDIPPTLKFLWIVSTALCICSLYN
ncbi:TPA: prepilin peptidase [Photobacterium damselae]